MAVGGVLHDPAAVSGGGDLPLKDLGILDNAGCRIGDEHVKVDAPGMAGPFLAAKAEVIGAVHGLSGQRKRRAERHETDGKGGHRAGKGRDAVVHLDRIARILGQADLICLQEVKRHGRDTDPADQPARLAALLPRRIAVFAPAVDHLDPCSPQRRHYGLLTLSRWPILTSRGFPLPKCPVQGRLNDQACPHEEVTAPGGQGLRRYNAHLNCLF